ncbi:MAG: 2,3-bisphosphoglycerate-independent phosphoglycerate mutase [bacterium]
MNSIPKPVMLLILDGWGYSENTEFNAIANANTPHWDKLWSDCPHTLISTSGKRVGLPDGQMGNSEVGHMNLGAGRIVFQEFTRISDDIANGGFFNNKALVKAVKNSESSRVHIMGLLSDGGVHSHQQHIHAAIDLAIQHGAKQVFVHAFLDGRDTPPRSAETYIQQLRAHITDKPQVELVSLTGRYYAMDRDNRWERVEQAWKLLARGEAHRTASSAEELLQMAYADGENDEFVKPSIIKQSNVHFADGDSVLFMNFRADRAREISRTFCDAKFDGFERNNAPELADYVCLTEYQKGLCEHVAYPPIRLSMNMGEYLSSLGKTQLRIAETEKYAHVTFFFSGGREQAYPGEERILVPSPQVATYDLQPEMSVNVLTEKLTEAIGSQKFDFIVCNIANPDMVGHTGVYEAAIKAVEAVDYSIGKIVQAIKSAGGELLITADHGNIEQMQDPETGVPYTAHTTNPVPLIYTGQAQLLAGGALEDLSPTLLNMMHLEKPKEMTGHSLLKDES